MKRWLLALTVLFGGSVTLAYADYVLIIANLGAIKNKDKGNLGGPGGFGPGEGTGGGLGGGLGGKPGGGIGGPPGGGIGGLPPPGAGFGGDAGSPDGGGEYGGYPGFNPADAVESSPLKVSVVVEIKNPLALRRLAEGKAIVIEHKWGKTYTAKAPLQGSANPGLYEVIPLIGPDGRRSLPTVARLFEAKKKELTKGGVTPNSSQRVELAEWALTHGLLPEFTKVMDELAAADKNNEVAVAYLKAKAALDNPLPPNRDGGAANWKNRLLEGYQLTRSEHFAILHNSPTSAAVEVDSLRKRLEANLRAFHYWFALRKLVLPAPEDRLVAVLVPDEGEFDSKHKIFDVPPPVADGFHARRDNLAVFSARRLDAPYTALVDFNKNTWQQHDRDKMLRGGMPRTNSAAVAVDVHTLAVLEKALEDDAEQAAVSLEGTRQLLTAANLLPRGVAAPEWVQFGWSSFFETPKGAFWPGTGAPSWVYLPHYKQLEKEKGEKKLEKPDVTLRNVVTDKYFRDALAAVERAKQEEKRVLRPQQPNQGGVGIGGPGVPGVPGGRPGPGEGPAAPGAGAPAQADKDKVTPEDQLKKARTLSWSLVYYLSHKNLDGLLRYSKELQRLPRDLQFDDEVLLNTFARAFDLLDGNRNLDDAKFKRFATEWRSVISQTPLEADEVLKEVKRNESELKTGG